MPDGDVAVLHGVGHPPGSNCAWVRPRVRAGVRTVMPVTDGVDVVVVGGRIAGCLTAIRLATRGVSVRLLESRDFPSDTLSTHFFRGDGLVRSLDEIGVLDEVLATGAPPMSCEYFSFDGSPFEQGPAPGARKHRLLPVGAAVHARRHLGPAGSLRRC